ncbi:alkylglycerol monooxygenase-like isoform X2 [Lycorma delicatula]
MASDDCKWWSNDKLPYNVLYNSSSSEIVGISQQYSSSYCWLSGLSNMFYLSSPLKTSFKTPEEVPHFYRQAWPYFLAFILIENIILWIEKKPLMRINDGITSLSHGVIQECGRLLFRGGEGFLYMFIYENYRLVNLPWDSPLTWYIAALSVDFCYYWVHRASHEIHIFWAQHQVHHSSEDFNLAVGLRQSILQGWCGFVFYLPMAFFVPPAHFLTHQQFSLLYQFWIHTETVSSLGPLEWILNTPKHHRVHHGSMLYCLDKNYGGCLIIWDRLFGTFAEEKKKQELIYGLVYNEATFNPFYLQIFYNANVYKKWQIMTGWKNKLFAIIKGPSWLPDKPWTGADEDKPNIKSRVKYEVKLAYWCNAYLIVHFIAVLIGFQELATRYMGMNQFAVLVFVIYIIGSLTVIGMMFDNHPHAFLIELVRCIILVSLIRNSNLTLSEPIVPLPLLQWFYILSAMFWVLHCLRVLQIKIKTK